MRTIPNVQPGQDILIKSDADVNDTVSLIVDVINKYCKGDYVHKLAEQIFEQSNNREQFLKHLFNFVCSNVKYKLDTPGKEDIATPERTVREGIGDCKKMTVLISCVLKAAGIEPLLKVISYDGTNYEHIYVIVKNKNGGYTTLDPVNNCKYNLEIPHKKATVIDLNNKQMDLHLLGRAAGNSNNIMYNTPFLTYIAGPNNSVDDDLSGAVKKLSVPNEKDFITASLINLIYKQQFNNGNDLFNDPYLYGIGKFRLPSPREVIDKATEIVNEAIDKGKEVKDKIVEGAGKVINVAATAGLAPARAAFLDVVSRNWFYLADYLAQAFQQGRRDRLMRWWQDYGGAGSKLLEAINKGNKKGITVSGIGEVDPAIIAMAASLTASLVQLLKEMGVFDRKKAKEIDQASTDAVLNQNSQMPEGDFNPNEGSSSDPNSSKSGLWNTIKWPVLAFTGFKIASAVL